MGYDGNITPVDHKTMSFQKNMIDSFPEVEIVQEENLEDDETSLNARRRQGRFKLLMDKNEFNKTSKRNRSTDYIVRNQPENYAQQISQHHFGDVSEDEEE